jgi:hypothetical protein
MEAAPRAGASAAGEPLFARDGDPAMPLDADVGTDVDADQ